MLSCVSWAWVAAVVLVRLGDGTRIRDRLHPRSRSHRDRRTSRRSCSRSPSLSSTYLQTALCWLHGEAPYWGVGGCVVTPKQVLARNAGPAFSLTSAGRSSAYPGSVRRTSVTGHVGPSATVVSATSSLQSTVSVSYWPFVVHASVPCSAARPMSPLGAHFTSTFPYAATFRGFFRLGYGYSRGYSSGDP